MTYTLDNGRGGIGFYRPRHIATNIGMSEFEYFDMRRCEWRTLRNADRRWALWHLISH